MTSDVNLLVVNVAKEDKGVVDDEGHFVLEVGLLDDCCPDLILSVVVLGVQMTIFSETLRSKMSSWTTRAACCATPCCAPVVDTLMT